MGNTILNPYLLDTKAERRGLHDAINGKSRVISNMPTVLMVMGSDSEAIVYFYAICSSGSTTTNATNPCGETSLPIQNFKVSVEPDGFPKRDVSIMN